MTRKFRLDYVFTATVSLPQFLILPKTDELFIGVSDPVYYISRDPLRGGWGGGSRATPDVAAQSRTNSNN